MYHFMIRSLEIARLPDCISDKEKSVPGFEPGSLGLNAIALLLAPPPPLPPRLVITLDLLVLLFCHPQAWPTIIKSITFPVICHFRKTRWAKRTRGPSLGAPEVAARTAAGSPTSCRSSWPCWPPSSTGFTSLENWLFKVYRDEQRFLEFVIYRQLFLFFSFQ